MRMKTFFSAIVAIGLGCNVQAATFNTSLYARIDMTLDHAAAVGGDLRVSESSVMLIDGAYGDPSAELPTNFSVTGNGWGATFFQIVLRSDEYGPSTFSMSNVGDTWSDFVSYIACDAMGCTSSSFYDPNVAYADVQPFGSFVYRARAVGETDFFPAGFTLFARTVDYGDIRQDGIQGVSFDVVFAPVPIPAPAGLLLLGFAGLAAVKKRRPDINGMGAQISG